MLVVITGNPGSGKTTILKQLNYKYTIYLDQWIHQKLYYRYQKGYKLIKKHFGSQYLSLFKVNRFKLGKLVFNDENSLKLLNSLIFPLVKKQLQIWQNAPKNYLIEQATYLKYENEFHNCYQYVVLIKRNQLDLSNKFVYLNREQKQSLLTSQKIVTDFEIDNIDIHQSVSQLQAFLKEIKLWKD